MKIFESNFYKTKRVYKGGFTLIELLVVISIIGILASIVLASMNQARAKARDAYILSTAKEFQKAFELYADNDPNNFYPPGTADAPSVNPLVYYTSIKGANTDSTFKNAIAPFMSTMPTLGMFSNSDKSGATMSRLSYSRLKNFFGGNLAAEGICTSQTTEGKCYVLLLYTETTTILGPAGTAIFLFNDGQKRVGYNPLFW
ncbi:MAG: type II secretion system protein [bacterium]|nr:type II secretion system protein [bacterium]